MFLNLSSCLSIASFAMGALVKVSVLLEALRRFGFNWARTAIDVTGRGRRSIQRWFTVQYTATPCRSSCSNVQYRSVVERDRKLNPEPRWWMLTISAAKLHIVRWERNLGAKMYYLSFKYPFWRLQMQPMMLFLDVDEHDSVSVFSKALVHPPPPSPIPPITAETVLLPKAKCVHI